VLSLGGRASAKGSVFGLRQPGALARALAAMFVAVPAFAVLVAATTPVPTAIKFAIVAMSVSPVPPMLPHKQIKAGGGEDYAFGLLVAASLASIVITPLLVAVATRLLGAQASIGATQVARALLLSIGLPLAAGMILHAVSERAAEAVSTLAQRAGNIILLAALAVMVGAARHEILRLFGDGAALAIIATVVVGLLAGHLLAGGPHRAALALAAASRHPGVALAIAEMSYPDQRKPITAAILLYLLLTALVTALYVRWVRGRAAAFDAGSVHHV
jgi:BASS family bile acid:Na+ symporter